MTQLSYTMNLNITTCEAQTKAFQSNLHTELCQGNDLIEKRIRLLSNMIVGRKEYSIPVASTWISSILYKESLNCNDLLIFLNNLCLANPDCIQLLDWDAILLSQRNNALYLQFCQQILSICPLFLHDISNLDLIYELCHEKLFANSLNLDAHLFSFPKSPLLLDLLDLLVIDQGIKSCKLLELSASILQSIHNPPSNLSQPTRIISQIESKKPLLLNLISTLLELPILKSFPIPSGYKLLSILLECCQYDQNIPFTREPSILCISRMTIMTEYNAFISEMTINAIHPSVAESLSRIGYKAFKNDSNNSIQFIQEQVNK